MAKKTTEQFVKQLEAARGTELFDYSKVVYTGSHGKIIIVCKTCSYEFSQDPSNHLKGVGCPKCSNRLSLNNETFLERILPERRVRYDYSKIEVKNNKSILDIRCIKHDYWFKQKAADHLSGRECRLCGRENTVKGKTKSTEEFISDAEAVHIDSYDYSDTEYICSSQEVKIYCKKHGGFFWQVPESHLAGRGCPECAKGGYKTTSSGSLYVLQFDNITKIGITNRTAKDRAKKINKSSGKNFKILFEFRFSDGRVPKYIETRLLRKLNLKYSPVPEIYDGSTESFLDVSEKELIMDITTLCTDFYKQSNN